MQAGPVIQDAWSVHRPLRPVGMESAGLGWDILPVKRAVTVMQGACSVCKPLRPVGMEPAGLGWDVLPVMDVRPTMQGACSVCKPLRPVGTESTSLGWDVLPVGHSIIHNPELSNLKKNDVAVAAFLGSGNTGTLMMDARESGDRTQPVVVMDDRRTKIDHFALAREHNNRKLLEKNAESWAIWQAHGTPYGEAIELQTVCLMMRDRTLVQQVEQLMSFMGFLLDEEEMNGKEMRSCVANLRVFFKVYNPAAEEAFKAKMVTDAIQEENKPTLQAQAEQARQRLCTQTQPIIPSHVLLLAGSYFDDADEKTEEGLSGMCAWLGAFLICNWGPRIGHVCGPYPGRRDHSLLVQDLWFYLGRELEGQGSTKRVCATQSVTTVEAMIQLGYEVVDMEFWLPTGKTVRENAEKVPPARVYRMVGADRVANELQARTLLMFVRYWKAAHMEGRPDDSFFAPALGSRAAPLRTPQRKIVNMMFKEAAVRAGLADNIAEAGAFTSKSGRNLAASLDPPTDGSQTQEWASSSNVPRTYYLRTNAALGGAAASVADTERVVNNVLATRASARHSRPSWKRTALN